MPECSPKPDWTKQDQRQSRVLGIFLILMAAWSFVVIVTFTITLLALMVYLVRAAFG